MKVKQLLKPSNWIQKELATTKQHFPVSPLNPNAVHFCLVGAIQKCYRDRNERKRIYRKVNTFLDFNNRYSDFVNNSSVGYITEWNDIMADFGDVKKLVNKLDI